MEKQGGVHATATRKSATLLRIPTGCPHHSDHRFLSSVITAHRPILVQSDYGLDSKLPGIVRVSMERLEVACKK